MSYILTNLSKLSNCINKTRLLSSANSSDKIVIIGGLRTPFISSHQNFKNLNFDTYLQSLLKAFYEKFSIEPEFVQYGIFGNAIQDTHASNLDPSIFLNISKNIKFPTHIIKSACLSSLSALISGYELTKSGIYGSIITGGFEFINVKDIFDPNFSNISIYNDFFTDRKMIDESELMCLRFGVSKEEADEYSESSFCKAQEALNNNFLDIVNLRVSENLSIDKDVFYEIPSKKSKINNKIFRRINQAGNSSRLCDGAGVTMVSSEKRALRFKYKPLAVIKDYVETAGEAHNNFLIGTAYSIVELLKKNELKFSDVGVWEIHEPFAGHTLVVLKCLNNPSLLGYEENFGKINADDINKWGGSLAFGHPFAATGSRLINMAVSRMKKENKKYAVVSACAPSGLGISVLLENYELIE